MSGGWGCPHQVNGNCLRFEDRICDPGMKGCVLYGRYLSSIPEKNPPRLRCRLLEEGETPKKKPPGK